MKALAFFISMSTLPRADPASDKQGGKKEEKFSKEREEKKERSRPRRWRFVFSGRGQEEGEEREGRNAKERKEGEETRRRNLRKRCPSIIRFRQRCEQEKKEGGKRGGEASGKKKGGRKKERKWPARPSQPLHRIPPCRAARGKRKKEEKNRGKKEGGKKER